MPRNKLWVSDFVMASWYTRVTCMCACVGYDAACFSFTLICTCKKACVDMLSLYQWSIKSPINLHGSTWIHPCLRFMCWGRRTIWLYQSSANMTLWSVETVFIQESVDFYVVFFGDVVAVGLSVVLGDLWCCSAADWGCWCNLGSTMLLHKL